MRCYRCNEEGHIARDCVPQRRRRGGRGSGQAQRAVRASDERSRHVHSCVKCCGLYSHIHPYNHEDHEQRPYQCPYPTCEWYIGSDTAEEYRTKPQMLEPIPTPTPTAPPTPEPVDPLVGPPIDEEPADESTPKGFSSFNDLKDHLYAYLTKQSAWTERTVLNRRSMVQRAETWLVSKKVESEVLRTQVIQAVIDTVDIMNPLEVAVTSAAQNVEWRNQHIAANRAAAGWLYQPPAVGWSLFTKFLIITLLFMTSIIAVCLIGPGVVANSIASLAGHAVAKTVSINISFLLANAAIMAWRGRERAPHETGNSAVFTSGNMGR